MRPFVDLHASPEDDFTRVSLVVTDGPPAEDARRMLHQVHLAPIFPSGTSDEPTIFTMRVLCSALMYLANATFPYPMDAIRAALEGSLEITESASWRGEEGQAAAAIE